MKVASELPLLSETERACLERYLDLLVQTLGEQAVPARRDPDLHEVTFSA